MISEILSKIESSDVFKNWNNKDYYLVSFFCLDDVWSVGYYSKKSKKIISFVLNGVVERNDEEQVFQDEKNDLEELELDEVKVSFEDALMVVNEVKDRECMAEEINNKIIVLQKKVVPIWNITYITSAFNVLNIKINACNKELLEKSFMPVFSLKKRKEQDL